MLVVVIDISIPTSLLKKLFGIVDETRQYVEQPYGKSVQLQYTGNSG